MILGFTLGEAWLIVIVALIICTTVCALAMEAAVLFTPAFLFLFPTLIPHFPQITLNEAIGLAIAIEFFGYSSSVTGYWVRRQIDFSLASRILAVSIPVAVGGRLLAYFVPEGWLLNGFGLLLFSLAGIFVWAQRKGHVPLPEYRPRTHLFRLAPPHPFQLLTLDWLDRLIAALAGAFGGLVGVGAGEISNVFCTAKKRIPIRIATGTSALVLHLTILSALITNMAILWGQPAFVGSAQISLPWNVAELIIPTVILGGQIDSFLNSRLPAPWIVRLLVTAYGLVGMFVLSRSL